MLGTMGMRVQKLLLNRAKAAFPFPRRSKGQLKKSVRADPWDIWVDSPQLPSELEADSNGLPCVCLSSRCTAVFILRNSDMTDAVSHPILYLRDNHVKTDRRWPQCEDTWKEVTEAPDQPHATLWTIHVCPAEPRL